MLEGFLNLIAAGMQLIQFDVHLIRYGMQLIHFDVQWPDEELPHQRERRARNAEGTAFPADGWSRKHACRFLRDVRLST